MILLISVYQEARITGVSHWRLTCDCILRTFLQVRLLLDPGQDPSAPAGAGTRQELVKWWSSHFFANVTSFPLSPVLPSPGSPEVGAWPSPCSSCKPQFALQTAKLFTNYLSPSHCADWQSQSLPGPAPPLTLTIA
jgi:hypothetical protein